MVSGVHNPRMTKKRLTQDIRIRDVPTDLVRRFRSALVADDITLIEWFMPAAALTADAHEQRVKAGKWGGGK